ncbi:STAS domain-containing protein [Planococcus beigongshangi]|uniref:STAS domain-containing protein n=1 Tax=Planococcus beigongshangi TaxID=2782536 RepID=UPI00193C2FF3|nr:STAS domain-containing protein [Planococcus beigongshangi]
MTIHQSINVGGLNFEWDLEQGKFLFEGRDSILFWTASAMRMFFDTIEEIAGEDATGVVMETTGYRQGVVVGEYFSGMDNVDIAGAAERIANTYASAGWGLAQIHNLDEENATLEVHLKNSWEYKINVAQNKKKGGLFLPAHYAGIFTKLFGRNIWYKVEQYQIEGFEESIIRYFPSDETIEENIHRLARLNEARQIRQLENLVEEKTVELKMLVKEISSPIIPVLEGIVVVPLLGTYDEERADELMIKTLQNLPKYKAEYLVLDLTGLNNNFTQQAASLIEKLGATARMIGTETVLVGISPKMSMVITESGIDISGFNCFQTLQHGIHFALAQKGRSIL